MSARRLLTTMVAGIGLALAAARAQPPAPRKVKVTGMVVNAVTGEGVTKALVQIMGQTVPAAFSGADGRFEVDDVPEGQYYISARKPRYFNEQELNNGGGGGGSAPTLVQPEMAEVRLMLTPEARIDGRVLDDAGEPVEGASVQAMMRMVQEGRAQWGMRAGLATDDNGEFSLEGLLPGDYVLAVTGPGGAGARMAGQGYDEIFPKQFYPGVALREQASVLRLSGGQVFEAAMQLKKTKGYRVRGSVTGAPPGLIPILFLTSPDDPDLQAWVRVESFDAFESAAVAPGAYTIRAMAGGTSSMFGETAVAVEHGDVKNIAVSLQPALHIPVQFDVSETHPEDANGGIRMFTGGGLQTASGVRQARSFGYLQLTPLQQGLPMGGGQALMLEQSADGEALELKNVMPGVYRARIQLNGRFYVESARAGDTNLLSVPLTVSATSGAPPIRISIRDDGATLDITIGQGHASPMAGLLVTSAAGDEPKFVFSAGQYRMQGVAPGDYRVYAFDNTDGLEYADPEALRDFISKGKAVSLSANQSAEVQVDLIHRGKP